MCGRYTLSKNRQDIADELDLIVEQDIPARFNIAPTQLVPVVTNTSNRHIEFFKWGLVPSWADDPTIGSRMINARAETVAEKPSFRKALLKRRCLVLADGFYEWKKNADDTKTPMYIRLKDHRVFAFAGLWETWTKQGKPLHTFTIITTTPNSLMKSIHDRMPVILRQEDHEKWLTTQETPVDKLTSLLKSYAADDMEAYAVSRLVNSPQHDSPDCIKAA